MSTTHLLIVMVAGVRLVVEATWEEPDVPGPQMFSTPQMCTLFNVWTAIGRGSIGPSMGFWPVKDKDVDVEHKIALDC